MSKSHEIIQIVGARPQFIKAMMISRAAKSHSTIRDTVIHTGQHYDWEMSGRIFKDLEMRQPDFNLNVGSASHGKQTALMLEALERIMIERTPSLVLVHGDTNSTLAGALSAAKLGIPVAHVEAGMRSFNREMPEEINRVIVDSISNLLFTASPVAKENLLREGCLSKNIYMSGDIMYDALLSYSKIAKENSTIFTQLNFTSGNYIAVTVHRAGNTDNVERLRIICEALLQLARSENIIFPVHPRTQLLLEKNALIPDPAPSGLRIISPLGYLDMLELERNAKLIVTDSGGVQKEAYYFRVPCVTLREETEWVELIESGWNRLVPLKDPLQVASEIESAIEMRGAEVDLYGKGAAAEFIMQTIAASLAA